MRRYGLFLMLCVSLAACSNSSVTSGDNCAQAGCPTGMVCLNGACVSTQAGTNGDPNGQENTALGKGDAVNATGQDSASQGNEGSDVTLATPDLAAPSDLIGADLNAPADATQQADWSAKDISVADSSAKKDLWATPHDATLLVPDVTLAVDTSISVDPTACGDANDCESFVVYHTRVTSESECYCPMCDAGTLHLNKKAHELNKASWDKYCGEFGKTCPVPGCVAPPERVCVDNSCQLPPVDATTSCAVDSDCATTPYNKPVTSVKDCYCVFCPSDSINLNVETATLYQKQWQDVCSDWTSWRDFPCPLASCVFPNPKKCVDHVCQTVKKELVPIEGN